MRTLFRTHVTISVNSSHIAAGFIAVLLCAAAASGQARTARGPRAILVPTTDTIAVTVQSRGQTFPFATAFRSVRHVTRDNRAAVELTYQWRGNDGSATADTLWIDARSMAPIENHRHNGSQDAVTTFDASSAHTRYTLTGMKEQRADTSVAGRLYASAELEDLIRSAPLALGYHGAYALYYGPPGQLIRRATFRVVGSQTIEARNGKRTECWVVDAPLTEGLNTFFISKADRRVIRLVNHEDPNAAFVFPR